MIDGIKLSAEIVTSLDSWRNKTGINLTTKVDSQSGNQLAKERTENNFTQRTIQYSGSFQNYNLSIKQVHKITPNAEVIDERTFLSINGSLHCNYHRGNNIYNFNFQELQKEIVNLCEGLDLVKETVKIDNLEFGVNIPFQQPVFPYLRRNLIQYKGNSFNRYNPDKTGKCIGYYCPLSQYSVKAYDKALQYNLQDDLMRFELRYTKMQPLARIGIKMLSDLLIRDKLEQLGMRLLKAWEDTLLYDGMLDKSDSDRAKDWKNPKYWERLKENQVRQFNEQRRLFRKALLSIQNNSHTKVLSQIEATISELIYCTNLPTNQNQEVYKLTLKINGKNSSNTSRITKRCLSCGRDISGQKNNSRYCSEKEVGEKNAHSCRNKISNLKKKIFREKRNGTLFPIEQTYTLTPPLIEVIKSLEI